MYITEDENMEKKETKETKQTEIKGSIELTKKESDELQMRQQLVNNKKNQANVMLSEAFLLEQGLKLFYNEIIDKYNLDKTKSYKYDSVTGTLTINEEVAK